MTKFVELGKVADVNWGDTSVTKASYVADGFPAYSATGSDGFLPYFDFDRDGIVLSAIGARCGKTWFTSGKWSVIKNTIRFWSESRDLDNKYLYWLTADPDFWPKRGAAQPFITIGDARKLKIPLPPLEEQKRIAAILDQADDIRRKRQHAIDRLNQLGQAIFHEMFGEWDQQDTKYSTVNLGDKIDFLTSGSRGWAEYYRDSGSTFLRIQNVKRDELDLSDVAYVDAPDTAESKRTRVQSGDVLLSITADLGRTAVIPYDIGDAYISQHLALIRAPAFDPRFLSAALSSPAGQRLILRRNREGVKAGLNFDDVRSVCLPDVPIEVQREFTSRVQTVDEIKITNRSTLTRTSAAFASLQHRAFTGQL